MRRLVAFSLTVAVTATGCATSSPSNENQDQTHAGQAPPAEQQPSIPPGHVSCRNLESKGIQQARQRYDDVDLPVRATGPVAVVNGREVSASRFNQFVRTQVPREMVEGPNRPDGSDASGGFANMMAGANTAFLINRLVDAEIIRQALDDADIFIDQDALDEEMTNYIQKKVPDNSDYQSYLDRQMLTDAEVRARVCRTLQRRQFIDAYDRSVTDEDVRAYYEANKDDFRTPATLTGRIIILKAGNNRSVEQARDEAASVSHDIRNGDISFKQAARQHSDGSRAKHGGRFESLPLEHFAESTTEPIQQLEIGRVSEPIRADVKIFGNTTTMFYVLRIDERSPAKLRPLDEFRDNIRNHLEQQADNDPYSFVMDELTRQATIETMPDNVTRE